MTAMRQLRQWTNLSYRALERRAQGFGASLPRATLAGVLNRQDLPREELLAVFVRACGGDAATVEKWTLARKRLAVDLEGLVVSGMDPDRQESAADPDDDPAHDDEPAAPTDTKPPDDDQTAPTLAPGPATEGSDTPAPGPGPGAEGNDGGGIPVSDTGQAHEGDELPHTPAEDDAPSPIADTPPAEDAPTGSRRSSKRRILSGISRRRRLTVTVATVLLLAAGTTGIGILRDSDDARPTPPGSAPANSPRPHSAEPTTVDTPIAAVSPVADDTPASRPSANSTPPAAGAPKSTPPAPPAPRTTITVPRRDEYTPPPWPRATSQQPAFTWPPYRTEPADPFPEETCHDVTNDCL
ncbi:hypothetical protein ACIBSV_43765 [Embleya sp. NPDC050154]|uniref:hypothetical protein n=1 Tax=Embleya sp. NPDC050154 TaxID=3363988 RepID=UPI003795DFDC